LAKALREVLAASPQQLATMGAAGAARVARMHDVTIEAAKLAGFFAESIAAEDRAQRSAHSQVQANILIQPSKASEAR
jgi:hypothetical protein